MRPTQLEFADPREWLIRLAAEADGFSRLVTASGGSARAAYRIARARCAASHGGEPSLEDLQSAAASLAKRVGSVTPLPITSLLPPPRSAPPPPVSVPQARVATVSAAPPAPSSLRLSSSGTKSRPRSSRASL